MEWMPLTVKSGDRRRDAASTRAGRTADWGNHSSLLESTRSFLCFPPSDHITTTSPTTLTHRLLPCVRSSLLLIVSRASIIAGVLASGGKYRKSQAVAKDS